MNEEKYIPVEKRIMIREVMNGYVVQDMKSFDCIPDEYAAENLDTVLRIVKKLLSNRVLEQI